MKKIAFVFSLFILAILYILIGFTSIANAQGTFVEKSTATIQGFLCDQDEYIDGEATVLVFYQIDKNGNVHLDGGIVQGGEATGSLGNKYRWIMHTININDWLPYPHPSPDSYNGAYHLFYTFDLRLICLGNKNETWMLKLFTNVVYDPNSPGFLHVNSYSSDVICK